MLTSTPPSTMPFLPPEIQFIIALIVPVIAIVSVALLIKGSIDGIKESLTVMEMRFSEHPFLTGYRISKEAGCESYRGSCGTVGRRSQAFT